MTNFPTDTGQPATFAEVVHPFTPTARLQDHLRQYPYEYGAEGREVLPWRRDVIGWRIGNEAGSEAGFVWLQAGRHTRHHQRFITVAVYDEFGRQGFASQALAHVEECLPALGINVLLAQVNSNKDATGRTVRAWLGGGGFRPVRAATDAHHASLTDAEYLAAYPHPLIMAKIYVGPLPHTKPERQGLMSANPAL